MAHVQFTDLQARPTEFLDFTSVTLDEFQQLVPPFEAAFQTRMAVWRMDGKPRTARRFRPKTNTRVTSRQLAYHALSVNRSRVPLCSQIAVDGPPTDLEGLPNLLHSETTVMQEP